MASRIQLKIARVIRGETQREVAERAGVTQMTVSNVERNCDVLPETLRRIERALNVPHDDGEEN